MKKYIIFTTIFIVTSSVHMLTSRLLGGTIDPGASNAFGMGIALFWAIETKK